MDLLELFTKNKRVLIAEGMLLELRRRGRLQAGSFVPEVVLDSPDTVRMIHQEFVDSGSDVVQACTYYANRRKMKVVGREEEVQMINRKALEIAKEVSRKNGKLFAGALCNSNIYDPDDPQAIKECESMFVEQCQWATEAGVDYMIAETFADYGEASLALKVLKEFGLTAVVSINPIGGGDGMMTFDGVPIPEALRRLEEEGADVVGLNCQRGPKTMIPLIEKCRAVCQGPIGCLPVCYNTNEAMPTYSRFKYADSGISCYPHDVQVHATSHRDIEWFAKKCVEIGIEYIGLCCGNDPSFMRSLANGLGKATKLDKYVTDQGQPSDIVVQPHHTKRNLHKFTME